MQRGDVPHGDKVSGFARQGVMFADPDQLQTAADFNNAALMMLADVLNDKRPTRLKQVLAQYNKAAQEAVNGQMDLFTGDVKSRQEILRDVINFLNNGNKRDIESAQRAAIEQRKASVQPNGPAEPNPKANGREPEPREGAEPGVEIRNGRNTETQRVEAEQPVQPTEEVERAEPDASEYVEQNTVEEYLADPTLHIENKEVTDGAVSLIENLRKAGKSQIDDDGASVMETLTTDNYYQSEVNKLQQLLDTLHADERTGDGGWRYLGDKTITWFDGDNGTYYSVSFEAPKYKGQKGKFGYTVIRYKKKGETNRLQNAEQIQLDLQEPKPIGKSIFGNVYDQFRGKIKEGISFLIKRKEGYLRGILHRDDIGDIDLPWGVAHNDNKGKGLAHIIRKHIDKYGDFNNIDEVADIITDVVKNGKLREDGNNTVAIEKDKYRVIVVRDNNGNWILSAFDYVTPKKEKLKKRKDAAALGTPGQPNVEAGAVTSNLSIDKDIQNAENKQIKIGENADNAENLTNGVIGNTIQQQGKTAEAETSISTEDFKPQSQKARDYTAKIIKDLRWSGINVSLATQEEAQRVAADAELMCSRTRNSQQRIGETYDGAELPDDEQAVVDVFSGKSKSETVAIADSNGRTRTIEFRQGNEQNAGVKHSIFRHFETSSNSFSADEIREIPRIIKDGIRKQNSDKRIKYTLEKNGVRYAITTEIVGGKEVFTNFFTNRNPKAAEQGASNTAERHAQPQHSDSDAKVGNNNETPKENAEILKTNNGIVYGWCDKDGIHLTPEGFNPNTPVHEYTHGYMKMLEATDKPTYDAVVKTLKETDAWQDVLNDENYKHLAGNEAKIASEVVSRLTGDESYKRANEKMTDKARRALMEFWDSVRRFFGATIQ